jgi:hypothetical protein
MPAESSKSVSSDDTTILAADLIENGWERLRIASFGNWLTQI